MHIGGHIAFDIERDRRALPRARAIFLIEDCAHAHGARGTAAEPGTFGDAGVYSFYATKTISTGEGGMLVSRHDELLDYARAYRDYGKPDHRVAGPELPHERVHRRAGLVQTERLDEIVAWKNAVARERPRPGAPRPARSCPTA